MATMSLGEFLETLRKSQKLSLRQVEEATDNEISNAYLSQLETGKIKKPSADILYTLANVYGTSYDQLMEKAGYLVAKSARGDHEKHGRVATRALSNLTKEEEEEVLKYIAFIKSRRSKKS